MTGVDRGRPTGPGRPWTTGRVMRVVGLAVIATIGMPFLLFTLHIASSMLGAPLIGYLGSCGAGTSDLEKVRSQILTDQPASLVSTYECTPSWDEPGRYVEAKVRPTFSCRAGLASFRRIYGSTASDMPPNDLGVEGAAERGDTRYHYECYLTDGNYEFFLRQEPISRIGRLI